MSPLWRLGFHKGAAVIIGVCRIISNITVGCWNAKGPELPNNMDSNKAGAACQHCLGDKSGHDVHLYLFDDYWNLLVDTLIDIWLPLIWMLLTDISLFMRPSTWFSSLLRPLKVVALSSVTVGSSHLESTPRHCFKVMNTSPGWQAGLEVCFVVLDESEFVVLFFIIGSFLQAAHFAKGQPASVFLLLVLRRLGTRKEISTHVNLWCNLVASSKALFVLAAGPPDGLLPWRHWWRPFCWLITVFLVRKVVACSTSFCVDVFVKTLHHSKQDAPNKFLDRCAENYDRALDVLCSMRFASDDFFAVAFIKDGFDHQSG